MALQLRLQGSGLRSSCGAAASINCKLRGAAGMADIHAGLQWELHALIGSWAA